MGGSKPPPVPMFMPPARYAPPMPFVQPPNPETTIPQVSTPQNVISQGNQVEGLGNGSTIPQWLQLGTNPVDQNQVNAFANYYYQTQIAPQIAQTSAQLENSGQQYGSYAGALLGQMSSQGQLDKFMAGLQNQQQQLQNTLAGRQSYYAGGPNLAQQQNAQNVARGADVAQLGSYNAAQQNQYNLGSAGMQNQYSLGAAGMQNQFGLQNYQNQLGAFNIQQQQRGALIGGLVGLGGNLLSLGTGGGGTLGGDILGGLGSGMFGRQAQAPASYIPLAVGGSPGLGGITSAGINPYAGNPYGTYGSSAQQIF